MLRSRKGFTVEDFQALQHDELSLPARRLVALLRPAKPVGAEAVRLLAWDCVLGRDSAEAAIFEVWIRKLVPKVWAKKLSPQALKAIGTRTSLEKAIQWLEASPGDPALLEALDEAVADLKARLGADPAKWSWGALHRTSFLHPLGKNDDLRRRLDRGPVPRGGDSNTVNNTGPGPDFRQVSGASYRHILDLSDWDRSVATSVPGQSGDPSSPHYDDLLPLWAEGRYFPLLYSRAAVERETRERLLLRPDSR